MSNPTPEPGRFRCLVCHKYVTGTPSGHCPQCGFVPPRALELPPAPPPFDWTLFAARLAVVLAFVCVFALWAYVNWG